MTTAVEAKAAEKAGVETATFYSKSMGLRLVRRPRNIIVNPVGQQSEVSKHLGYHFAPEGRITVVAGQDVLMDGPVDPETMEPTAQDALGWLRSHPQLNVLFFEDGAEPDRPRPTDKEFYAALKGFAESRDVAAIAGLVKRERATHNREALIEAALTLLTALGGSESHEAPQGGWEDASREEMVLACESRGISVPEETTDEQLRAALDLLPSEEPAS